MRINRRTYDDLIALATVRPGFAAARAKTMGLVSDDLPADCLVTALTVARDRLPGGSPDAERAGASPDFGSIDVPVYLSYDVYGTCRYRTSVVERVLVRVDDVERFIVDGELDRDRLQDYLDEEAPSLEGEGENVDESEYDYSDFEQDETDSIYVDYVDDGVDFMEDQLRAAGMIE